MPPAAGDSVSWPHSSDRSGWAKRASGASRPPTAAPSRPAPAGLTPGYIPPRVIDVRAAARSGPSGGVCGVESPGSTLDAMILQSAIDALPQIAVLDGKPTPIPLPPPAVAAPLVQTEAKTRVKCVCWTSPRSHATADRAPPGRGRRPAVRDVLVAVLALRPPPRRASHHRPIPE